VLLAERFAWVVATDASAQQVANAERRANVEYRVAPAEASGLDGGSVDLVVAAQAAHWFNLPAFYAEARRVSRPPGVVALVTYGIIEMDEPVDALVKQFYRDVVGPYWPPERRHVEEGYRSFEFPFTEFAAPPLAIEAAWTLDAFSGYVDTWSAVKAAEAALGRGPIERFREELASAWGDPATRRPLRFPLSLRVGRV
jgi:SAM-dependent methyltransferase